MGKKIIVLAAEPISGAVLQSAVGEEVADDAEVLVVAPALNSRLRFLMSDPDRAIERAQDVADESAERMDEADIDAAGETGEADPLQALQDAFATFDADEIVLCTHRGGERNWLEEGVVDRARERFPDQPVRHFEIDRDEPAD
jgi:hypothetical protein